MEAFPFSKADWQKVQDVSHSIVNATLADDSVLQESLFAELSDVLNGLRLRYGEHPVLLETEADFCDDLHLQVELYRSAITLAETHRLPTFTIRISLADVLLHQLHDAKQAARELAVCESELAAHADESEKREWSRLLEQCGDTAQ